MRIAWGITGAGHFLQESIDLLEKLIQNGHIIDLFLSGAGQTVIKMYGLLDKIEKLKAMYPEGIKHIYLEQDQAPGFPVCARFNLEHYQLLVIAPLTANSVGKMNAGIADSLITNIFSQMIKGGGKIFLMPCDLIPGEIETVAPGAKKVKIHIDQFNSDNAKALTKFPNVSLFETPVGILNAIK